LNKKVYKAVSERAGGECENCQSNAPLELHHITGRLTTETADNCMMLCYKCHRSEVGVHGRDGRRLAVRLKVQTQQIYFSKGMTEAEVRKTMGGKIY